ncbi:enoyl-CoA hydratase-related protein [Zhaonella formicivorans]|uniref:enoyl-CoA hydratase-related protein n=1 Tax=Zhaonella formicivorans TaxID=2528593 RepID=UPI0010E41031|nr:enoyl-CoA hydratase-related protein [Zhaonella formicivorans]
MEFSKLIVEQEEGFIIVFINNPPANALSTAVLLELEQLLDKCVNDDNVRAIVITGSGKKVFSAGADINEFEDIRSGKIPTTIGQNLFNKIENYPKPIIAAIQGSAFGGGNELIMSCHLRILSSNASLSFPEVKLGITTGWGGTQRLPRLIGKTRALEMLLTGDPISPENALNYGLVNKVVEAEKVLEEAKTLAAKLAKGAPIAIREFLRGVTQGLNTSFEQGLSIEREGSAIVFASEDAKEGVAAFFEKRSPNFTGK